MNGRQSGFYGWKLVAAFFVILFVNSAFPMYGASIINPYMMVDLQMDREALGLLFSVYVLVLSLSSPLAAFMVNRRGVRFTLVLGSLFIAGGALGMATLVEKVWQAYVAFGLVVGMGFALGGATAANAGAAFWFVRRRAFVLSLNMIAIGIGGFVAPTLLNYVIAESGGAWRAGWWVVVALALNSAACAGLFVKNRPSDIGQFPDGETQAGDAGISPERRRSKSRVYMTAEEWVFRETLRAPVLWLIIFATMAYYGGMVPVISHGVVHLKDLGHSPGAAAMAMSIVGICMLVGKIIIGLFGDRIEPRYFFAGSLTLMSLGIVALIGASSTWLLGLFSVAFGIGSGGVIVCLYTVLSNFFGAKVFASILGLTFCLSPATGALLGWFTGAYFEDAGTYAPVFWSIAGWCFVASVVLPLLRPPSKSPVRQQAATG
jgi:MFS family permease